MRAASARAVAIAKAAKRLDELRNAWLNPPDLIDIVPEVVSGQARMRPRASRSLGVGSAISHPFRLHGKVV
jgi:hypothetical protein